MQSPLSHIPEKELELVADFIHSEFKLYPSDEAKIRAYRKSGHFVISDCRINHRLILDALKERKPFSIENRRWRNNLMTYRKYPGTLRLDKYGKKSSICKKTHSGKRPALLCVTWWMPPCRQIFWGVGGAGSIQNQTRTKEKGFWWMPPLLKENIWGKSRLFKSARILFSFDKDMGQLLPQPTSILVSSGGWMSLSISDSV